MLEVIVNNRWMYVLAGGITVVGVISKIVSNFALKRMVHAAGNMSKSNHSLMRLVRAKFEHACMISEKVENVKAFVDKYLYEHKTMGMRLHTWQRMQMLAAAFCLAAGLLGAFSEYLVNGMNDEVIRIGAYGGILGILLYLFHLTTDEKYQLEVTRNYMVDYLENVCLRKYEKTFVKNEKREAAATEEPVQVPVPETKPQVVPEPQEVPVIPAVTPPVKEVVKEAVKETEKDKNVLIRQILEEFMA